MTAPYLLLDYAYAHEVALRDKVFLTQPVGGGQVVDYTWSQTMDQARRMAAHLKALDFEPGARIAILSKNCAHFFMAENQLLRYAATHGYGQIRMHFFA